MIIGLLTTKGSSSHPNTRLMDAAVRLGHQALFIHPEKCVSSVHHGEMGLEISSKPYRLDVLLPRIGATIKDYTITLVRHFEFMGVPVINRADSIVLARNKFLTLQSLAREGIPIPDSYFVSNLHDFLWAVDLLGGFPVVAKTTIGRQGQGVVRVDSPMTAEFILHNLPRLGHGLLVQEYIPPEKRKDVRVLVLGGEIVAAMELRPKAGDFRTNIHLKGEAGPVTLDDRLITLALRASKALDLEISGVDIIIDTHGMPKVIEVNYAPGFRGLEAATGMDIAASLIQYVTHTYGDLR